MIKATNILALCGIVLVLACGASADEYVDFDWHGENADSYLLWTPEIDDCPQ